ncbi:MAG: endonuclease/exonuclease/phosphatase family protein [Chromatiales bacterium]|nr:endonuclease/exonuclease/phosphatase family protein [Gammaproteobacteria bacterium]MBW6476202.1 endonuclease/exonuclease/phosphatase family protein [Chromatiales bacterium]
MQIPSPESGHRLRLLSYNVQVGISSTQASHYLTKSWKHLLPAARRFENLDRIAQVLRDYDIVGLQELDAGSHRTGYVHLTEYLANKAHYPFWHHQLNRDLGRLAQHGNGLLSRFRPSELSEHKLPGMLPGRGALLTRYGHGEDSLVVIMAHLALSARARERQLGYLIDVINQHRHVVLMGDLNCSHDCREMMLLFRHTHLREPAEILHTYPSWRPERNIDHILVSRELTVERCQVLNHAHSDHLPIAMELTLPQSVVLG